MKKTFRTETSRRRLAVLGCLVWMLGVEVLPALHQASHAWLPAHRHEGDARPGSEPSVTVRRDATSAATHAHEGVFHRHGGGGGANERADVDLGIDSTDRAPDPGHGRHSLAHHTLALRAPAPAILHPLPVDHHVVPVSHAVARLVAAAPPPDAGARAPPA
jgi:hypothetical protein